MNVFGKKYCQSVFEVSRSSVFKNSIMASNGCSSECYCINFNGRLGEETFGKLTIEYLKYILYLRGQIPCLFDQARSILQTRKDTESQKEKIPRICFAQQRREKRIQDSLAAFDLLFKHLTAAVTELPVLEVVFTMGATLVSPKELYLLIFPSRSICAKCKETVTLTQRSCMMNFFKAIATADIVLGQSNSLLMKIAVLLRIPRGCDVKHYMNIRNYKIPNRGRKTVIQINHICCEHQSAFDNQIETTPKFTESQTDELLASQMEHLNLESGEKENMFCWIQLSPVVKGFKDTITPNAQVDDALIFL